MGIPKQYGEYLQARGLLDKEPDEEELKKQAEALVMDDDQGFEGFSLKSGYWPICHFNFSMSSKHGKLAS